MRFRSQSGLVVSAVVIGVLSLSVGGCATGRQTHSAVSVVEYLYPDTKSPVVKPAIPVLTLPLRVGIAFVPGSGYRGATALTETSKIDLMKTVAEHFRKYPYVKEIEIIPSAYLRPKGSFTNLDQIRTMYGIDVIALVSYDQVQFTDQGVLSLSYWTIVGAYVVPGEMNDTHTMLDTVVYDIASRKMLFRAPGTHHIKGRATPVNLAEQRRLDSGTGFSEAAKDMIANLDLQLAAFKDKVKERPAEYRVVHTPEYTSRGGGSLDAIMLVLVSVLAAGSIGLRRRGR